MKRTNSSLPVLDDGRCTGCTDCVAVCPTECLAMGGSRPWLPRPLDCVSCTLCEMICPVGAIHLAKPEAIAEHHSCG